jgi:hypothetical protein
MRSAAQAPSGQSISSPAAYLCETVLTWKLTPAPLDPDQYYGACQTRYFRDVAGTNAFPSMRDLVYGRRDGVRDGGVRDVCQPVTTGEKSQALGERIRTAKG